MSEEQLGEEDLSVSTVQILRVLEEVIQKYPSCRNFVRFDVTREELIHAICCLSWHLQHNTGIDEKKGGFIVVYCKSCGSYQPRDRTGKKQENRETSAKRSTTKICPFYLSFIKKGELWHFRRDHPEEEQLNSLERMECFFAPDLLRFSPTIGTHLKTRSQEQRRKLCYIHLKQLLTPCLHFNILYR